MKYGLVFSDKYILNKYFRLLYLLIGNKQKTIVSIKTAIRLKLSNRKILLRLYKRILQSIDTNILNYSLIFSYCLLKRYLLIGMPWIFGAAFSIRHLLFFLYHFLSLYRAIFSIKMMLDWFPIKNWDQASPLKRFLRRATIDWTKQFEKYFPSIFAWIIVINIVPILLSLIEGVYLASDFSTFPISYNFDEVLEFVLESNLHTFNQKFI